MMSANTARWLGRRAAAALLLGLGLLAASGCYWSESQREVVAFGQALRHIERDFVGEVDRKALYNAAMEALVGQLGDRHTFLASPEELKSIRQDYDSQFGGIGVSTIGLDGGLVVVEVFPDSPAQQAGIQAGDVITHVDGRPLKELDGMRAAALVRGKPRSWVELALQRPSTGESLTCRVQRERIRLRAVEWSLREGVGHLRIHAFSRRAAAQTRQALAELAGAGARGIILDLRGNPGGLLDQAVEVADLFLAEGVILALHGRSPRERQEVHASPEVGVDVGTPLVVLVNEATASAAEIVAGALKANGRAVVVGARTVGKGSVNNVYPLADGSGLVLTVARYTLAGDRVVEEEGIQPDIEVGHVPPLSRDANLEEVNAWLERHRQAESEQLERALEVLRDRMACR